MQCNIAILSATSNHFLFYLQFYDTQFCKYEDISKRIRKFLLFPLSPHDISLVLLTIHNQSRNYSTILYRRPHGLLLIKKSIYYKTPLCIKKNGLLLSQQAREPRNILFTEQQISLLKEKFKVWKLKFENMEKLHDPEPQLSASSVSFEDLDAVLTKQKKENLLQKVRGWLEEIECEEGNT